MAKKKDGWFKNWFGLNNHPTHKSVRRWQWMLHLAIPFALYYMTWTNFAILYATFAVFHGLGAGIGAHRYFTHKSFTTSRFCEWLMSLAHTIASGGSTIGYVLIHIPHHAKSDKEGDPHNPNEIGFWNAWVGNFLQENLKVGPKTYMRMLNKPVIGFTHKHYWKIIAAYNVLVLAIGGPIGWLYAYAVPAIMVFHVNSALIVLTHYKMKYDGSYRPPETETSDDSYNLHPLTKFIFLGEEMHHNHHYKPSASNLNIRKVWYEFDPLYYVIKLLRTDK